MARRIVFTAPPVNPFLQVLYLIVGAIVIVVALFMGAVILAVVLGAALIFGIVIWLRVWWLRRKMLRSAKGKRQGQRQGPHGEAAGGGVEITGVEYKVVRESRRDREDA